MIDFVGQKPPTWRLGLLLFDILIWAVQCLMLAVHQEREKLRKTLTPSLRSGPGGQESAEASETTQDLDAEERGVLRDEDGIPGGSGDDIEMHPLVGRDGRADDGGDPETDQRIGASSSQTAVDLVDAMWSGTAVLSNFHVVHAIRTVGNDVQSAAAYSLQSLGYTASLAAAIAAERRARLAARRQRPQ